MAEVCGDTVLYYLYSIAKFELINILIKRNKSISTLKGFMMFFTTRVVPAFMLQMSNISGPSKFES